MTSQAEQLSLGKGEACSSFAQPKTPKATSCAKYALSVLFLVNLMNFMDRSIMGVLLEDIKADLALTDAELGFLGGAAFAIFYSIFGMAFGRFADAGSRRKLIAAGISCWSIMTVLTGFARGFTSLAACRFGVGVGESCSTPAAISLLYDYFPPKVRTTVLAIFDCGSAIGAGLGIFFGGLILTTWVQLWPDPAQAPLGLKGWQAAFLIVGLPGLLVAILVSRLKEPIRGQYDNSFQPEDGHQPLKEAVTVLLGMLPFVNLWVFSKSEKKRQLISLNIAVAASIFLVMGLLCVLGGAVLQLAGLGIGLYALVSWAQGLADRDPVIWRLIFHCKTLVLTITGMALVCFTFGISFWTIPYFLRYHGVSISEVSSIVGIGGVFTGVTGLLLGGLTADFLKKRTSRGKLYVLLVGVSFMILAHFGLIMVTQIYMAYGCVFLYSLSLAFSWNPMMSTLNDLMIPRGRATISALCILTVNMVGIALAPYILGIISDTFVAQGFNGGAALGRSLLCGLIIPILGFFLILFALYNVEADQKSFAQRACL